MQQSQADADDRQSDDQPAFENYLPGAPRISTEPGRIERFLTSLFRQRGSYRIRLRRD